MEQPRQSLSFFTPLAVFVVSVYMCIAGLWLVVTRQIPSPGVLRILRSSLRRPFAGTVTDPRPESGLAWVAELPEALLSDLESRSRLALTEDGHSLGPAHAGHEEIRTVGAGRFSHWGSQIYFSTSDGSDPRTNGRRYEIRELRG